ncbi:MAG: response regulator [Planctomycetota bacterium]
MNAVNPSEMPPMPSETMDSRVLVVDDEELNLRIITKHLESLGLKIDTATDGVEAWELLEANHSRYEVILLDRMMPNMGGMELLDKIRKHKSLQLIQVIMQTAKAGNDDVADGLRAGANFYLTKPFDGEVLRVMVASAVQTYRSYVGIHRVVDEDRELCRMVRDVSFSFRTLDEAKLLATRICMAFPDPDRAMIGLVELMINAVEHGNLGITYEEKSQFLKEGTWVDAVNYRLQTAPHEDRVASISLSRSDSDISVEIVDQGDGFEWQEYLDFSTQRAYDLHGRGIAMAGKTSFDSLEYTHGGRRVLCRTQLSKK